MAVDVLGDDLFSGPALALYQYGRFRSGDLGRHLQKIQHRRILGYKLTNYTEP